MASRSSRRQAPQQQSQAEPGADLDSLVVQVEGLDLEDNKAGSGAYGVVFRVTVQGRQCIAKKLHNILLKAGDYYPADQRDSIIEKFRNECIILSGLNHSNVVGFIGVHYGRDKNDISLIMERLHTDLAAFVQTQPQTPIPERIQILYDVSKGLQYLHSLTPPLIHRDLTAANILLTEDLMAKIGDLGVSRYVDLNALTRLLTQAPGNIYYMSPEARAKKPVYSVKLDIFSFGTLIIHTFTGQVPALHDVPYDQEGIRLNQEGKIELTRRSEAIAQMTTDHRMYPLIVRCLHDKPDPRPTAVEVNQSLQELCHNYPTKQFQKMSIKSGLSQKLKEGDTWYLVDAQWMKQWKVYVRYDEESLIGQPASPGPVNTSNLLTDGSLRENLTEGEDYFLLPESAWNKLSAWYKVRAESMAISREVVRSDTGLMVEIYQLELHFCVYPELKDIKCRKFSRADKLATLEKTIKQGFGVPALLKCRLYCYQYNSFQLLSESDQTLQRTGLFTQQCEQIVVLEKQSGDGSWPQTCSPVRQKLEIEAALAEKLVKGDTWFLVDAHWMRQWRKHVSVDVETSKPGPVDNSNLCHEDSQLKDNMMVNADYVLLPEPAWIRLCFWYGLSQGSKAIKRSVIDCGEDGCLVEVYPLTIRMMRTGDSNFKSRNFSRADTVADLETAIREEFGIPPRLQSQVRRQSRSTLLNSHRTLLDAGLHNKEVLELLIPEDLETQKNEIRVRLKKQLRKGDKWCVVDMLWIKQWKKYVGFDIWDQSTVGKAEAHPGPLDNSSLFRDGKLREHLMDELDYYLVPEGAWTMLFLWYGLSSGSKVISRRVVEYRLYMKHCKVEVYLLEFRLCVHPQLDEFKKREFSRADTVADLEKDVREEFGIPSSRECRVWHRYMTHTYELLQRSDQTLQDAGLYTGQTIVLEVRNNDGSWPRTTSEVQ